jgi:hypothetical protein
VIEKKDVLVCRLWYIIWDVRYDKNHLHKKAVTAHALPGRLLCCHYDCLLWPTLPSLYCADRAAVVSVTGHSQPSRSHHHHTPHTIANHSSIIKMSWFKKWMIKYPFITILLFGCFHCLDSRVNDLLLCIQTFLYTLFWTCNLNSIIFLKVDSVVKSVVLLCVW